MIGRSTLPLAAFVLTTAAAAPAALAAYDGNDAIRACQKQITSSYGLDDFYNVSVDERKAGRNYNVSGTVRIKDASDQPFSCRIRDRSVKKASVENVDSDDNGGSGLFGGKEAGAAAVVGALATGAAALLGGGATGAADGTAATGAQSNDAAGITWGQGPALGSRSAVTTPSTSTSTTSAGTSAAAMTRSNLELREACGDALRTKLQTAGSSPRQILLDSVDVDDRAVRSEGLLVWQGGRRSDLSVTCNWDRSGRLYVADYSVK